MTGKHQPDRQERVPRIADLRAIAQGEKVSGDRRWSYRLFRSVSIYVTWAVLHTPATPNQITAASIAVGVAGLFLVAASAPGVAILGCVLLLAYHTLDRVDGEVARYRQIYSLRGIYLDNAGHYVTGAGLLVAAAFRMAPLSTEPQAVWLLGSLGAIAVALTRVEKHAAFHLFAQYVLERPALIEDLSPSSGPLTREAAKEGRAEAPLQARPRRGVISMVRDFVLAVTNFPVTVLLFGLAFAGEAVSGTTSTPIIILYVIAILQIIAYAGIEFANLTQNLGAESRRLGRLAGLLESDHDEAKSGD